MHFARYTVLSRRCRLSPAEGFYLCSDDLSIVLRITQDIVYLTTVNLTLMIQGDNPTIQNIPRFSWTLASDSIVWLITARPFLIPTISVFLAHLLALVLYFPTTNIAEILTSNIPLQTSSGSWQRAQRSPTSL